MVRSIIALPLLAATSLALVAAEDGRQAPKTVPGAYIIEFDEGQDFGLFRRQAEPSFKTRMELNYELFNGVSIQLDDLDTVEESVSHFASLPAVKNIWPVTLVPRPEAVVESPKRSDGSATHNGLLRRGQTDEEGYAPHVMTQIDKLHAKGITGKGTTVAIVDTGVDYTHTALGGCFGEGCIVSSGYDLAGDIYNGENTPEPDDDPMDCTGHGTHVAGIISARENAFGFVGAAPGASLAVYRVFGCAGSSANDILIAGFNMAYEDGADIISSSIGGISGWSSEPWAVAVSRIVENGVPCIMSAGNNGYSGLFDASTAASGMGIAAVASADNTVSPLDLAEAFYTIDGGPKSSFGYQYSHPVNWDNVKRPLWVTGNANSTADACEPLPNDTPNLSGYNVLVRQGSCTFSQQARNVAAKGGRFFLAYSNVDGPLEYYIVTDVKQILAAALLTKRTGEMLTEAVEAGSKVILQMPYDLDAGRLIVTDEPNSISGGAVSRYTSWGPTFEMNVKPQFGGPGGYILSTFIKPAGYSILSGTSMACPLVAAAYALIAEARGTRDPATIEHYLASTANPRKWQGDKNIWYDWLAPPTQQGAGLIQVFDAAYTSTLLEPSSLSFNDTDHFEESLSFTLTNNDDDEITYQISYVPTHTYYTLNSDLSRPLFPNEDVSAHAELAFSTSKVTIAAGDSATIEVAAIPPEGLNSVRVPVYSGYIAVNASDGTSLSLLYQGAVGSLYDADIMLENNVYLSRSDTGGRVDSNFNFRLPVPGAVFDPYEYPLPQFYWMMEWGSLEVKVEVVPVGGDGAKPLGQAAGFPVRWYAKGRWSDRWVGQLGTGEFAPEGTYKLVISSLRILGDASKEEDWLVRETVPFNIEYWVPE